MRKAVNLGLVGLLTAISLGSAPMALAKDGDVIRRGSCTVNSQWKLKNSPENNGSIIEVNFEVDSNVVGQTWAVALRYNGGTPFYRANLRTVAPSGSFTVRSLVANRAGIDRITAVAVNAASGERCVGAVTSNF